MRDTLPMVLPGCQFMNVLIQLVSSVVAMSNGCVGVRCACAVRAIAVSAKAIRVDFLFIVYSFISVVLGVSPVKYCFRFWKYCCLNTFVALRQRGCEPWGAPLRCLRVGGCLGLTLVQHSFSTVCGRWFMMIVLFNICSIM